MKTQNKETQAFVSSNLFQYVDYISSIKQHFLSIWLIQLLYYLYFNQCSFAHGFRPIPSNQMKPDKQNINGLFTYHFFLIDPSGVYHEKINVRSQNLRKSFFALVIKCFYSAILTSCNPHDVDNVNTVKSRIKFYF